MLWGQHRAAAGVRKMKWVVDDELAEQVRLAAEKMGQDMRAARLARRQPRWDAAMRAKVSESTYKRMERGDATVALRLWLQAWGGLGLLDQLADATSPHRDAEGERRRRIWANVRVRRAPRRAEDWDG